VLARQLRVRLHVIRARAAKLNHSSFCGAFARQWG
jgi:hypothetical protein